MNIIKDIATLKAYNKVSDKLVYADIEPYIKQAEDEVLHFWLGKTITDLLVSHHNTLPTPNNAENTALLPYAQKVAAHYALYIAKADLNINVGSAGFTTASTAGFVVASSDRSTDFANQQHELFYAAVEDLLNYMVTKTEVSAYASWLKTEACQMATELFIRTRQQLAALTAWQLKSSQYHTNRITLRTNQDEWVETVMGSSLTAKIITLLNAGTMYDVVNSEYLKVFRIACQVIAFASMYNMAPQTDIHRDTYKMRAKNYQSALQKHLDTTATSSVIPEYFNSGLQNKNTTPLGYTNTADGKTLKMI